MQGPNTNTNPSTLSFKKAFLKNLLMILHARTRTNASSSFDAMSPNERKRAVKSSADFAMAAARGAGARWPRAILASPAASTSGAACKGQRCRRILRRCRGRKISYEARRLVRRRTMALRELVPGGRDAAMDEASLLRETMDYVVHLRAQVDVLRQVSQAVQRSSSSTSPTTSLMGI